MIGNSVSPLISKAVFSLLAARIGAGTRTQIAAE